MRKITTDKWSDYPLKFSLNFRNFFILNSRFFHPKPLFILSLWFFGLASILSLKLLKIFIPLLILYFYQKLTIKRSLKNFRIKKNIPPKSKEEKAEEFIYQVDNPNPFEYFNFSLIERNETSSSQRNLTAFYPKLEAHQSKRIHHLVPMDNGMGNKSVGPIAAVFTDSLGINRVTYVDDSKNLVKIFPKVHPTIKPPMLPDQKSMTFGNFDSHQKGNNVNFYSTREYVQGDNTNHINWKLSLKSSQIIVNQFESNVNAQFYTVILDDERLHYGDGRFSSLEYCKDLILSLLHTQVKSNNEMGLFSSQKFIKAKSGQSHLNALEIYIATLQLAKIQENRSYTKKTIDKKKIEDVFRKLNFFIPREANLYLFAGFVPGPVLEVYLHNIVQLSPKFEKVHLVLTYGMSHLKENLSKDDQIWLGKMEAEAKKMSPEIISLCKKNNIQISLVEMNSKFKYEHTVKQGFQSAKL